MMEHPVNSTWNKFSCAHLSFQVPGSIPRHGGDCDKLRGAPWDIGEFSLWYFGEYIQGLIQAKQVFHH